MTDAEINEAVARELGWKKRYNASGSFLCWVDADGHNWKELFFAQHSRQRAEAFLRAKGLWREK